MNYADMKTWLVCLACVIGLETGASEEIAEEVVVKTPYGQLVGKRRQESYDIGAGAYMTSTSCLYIKRD